MRTVITSRMVLAVVTALALGPWAVPATATDGHQQTWSFSRGGITASFSGRHDSSYDQAWARTANVSYTCGLKVRLKWKDQSTGAFVTMPWKQSSSSPLYQYAPAAYLSVSQSSQHQAQHCWDLTWSTIYSPVHGF